jgi:hypothetical protein
MNVTRLARAAGVGFLVSGLIHLIAPRRLLGVAETGYRRVLAVDFDPMPAASRRVRLVGLLFVACGAALLAPCRK